MKGTGRFKDANTIAVEGGEDVTFKSAIVATGSFPIRPPIEGLDSPLCVDSTGLLAQERGAGAARRPRRRDHRLRVRLDLPALRLRGDDRRDAAALIPMEDEDASKELAKQFGKRGIALHLEKQCTKVEDTGGSLTVHFGEGETVEADLMLVVGRPRAARRGPRPRGDRRRARPAQGDRRRRAPPDDRPAHLRGRRLRRLLAARAHRLPRGRGRRRERDWATTRSSTPRGVPRPIYTDPEIAGVGLTEAEAREQYGDDVAVGVFPWVANARAVMQNETVGWVKSIHETRYGELLGLVMVGPHVTDLIEAGVVALDAEATVETVADGMTAHPTLSEAIKEAGLVALGRPIHMPPKRRAAAKA